ncbi:unnamed protein product [Arctia plantaginis]|uniref:Uncharacterized protein n=1 Tax=Arctia plantaginis TaxID=874455 RepID=A0A8S1AXZ2_ARCPL|nr:unnamed protein product [Arctia plantaginis]
MGKQQSRPQEEKIVIAQNGAGNGAAASAVENQYSYSKYEFYLLFIIICILAAMLYLLWKRCKVSYARYMRRELQDLPMVDRRSDAQCVTNRAPPTPSRVII